MALGATIHRLRLQIADIDRGFYGDYPLTLARHPSETEQRLMLRVLAFALYAHDDLTFGRGLSTDDEPDLWQHAADGRLLHWIELGLPDERRLRKACGRADRVTLLAYGESKLAPWWRKHAADCAALPTLQVISVTDEEARALAALCTRAMQLSATVQEGAVLVSDGATATSVTPASLQAGWSNP